MCFECDEQIRRLGDHERIQRFFAELANDRHTLEEKHGTLAALRKCLLEDQKAEAQGGSVNS